ncbi:formate dehydrogenase subunit alpha [Ruegeria sp. SCSIO 43209]|uniref:formate dehydrogenase subunit alpha n=1 Tax=Ruegeria sp. SCSIO 43209 TaxID=2793010 RepID=UPI001CA7D027|nr:formate dehydrogenase subunit alpha [Ruegeria sp. SCSIO 43209]UAB89513.1 formate dehydrogenase subunit alpha [Ruegeria sp. SCSIO 43209]
MLDASPNKTVTFNLNGEDVTVPEGWTIWEAAKGQGFTIPHLCHKPQPGYKPDGNCRACMVEVEGERTLVASCIRPAADGMVVKTDSDRAEKSRAMVMELLVADQPEEAHDASSHFWDMAKLNHVSDSRFPAKEAEKIPLLDDSHVAMRVNLDACINCNLCVRACRDVQVNDVIGMAGRGHTAQVVFDQNDPMGASTCVACGECVQACPTGALMPATVLDDQQRGDSKDYDSETESVCPFCGVGCKVSLKVKDGKVKYVEGINGPANEGRLCVKGRFGFDYIHHPHRLTKPLIRREDAPAKGLNVDPGNLDTHFREATWEEAMDLAATKLMDLRDKDPRSVAGFGSAKCTNEEAYLFQKFIRQGFRHNNVDHCTRLCHASSVAALIENVGSGAVTATFNEIENADVAIIIGANPIENHPVAATYFKQFTKRGGKLIVMDPRGVGMRKFADEMLQFRPGADVSMLNAIMNVIVEEELYDSQYIHRWTENWEAEKEHLRQFTPEAMSPICGIEPDQLRRVARTFAQAKAGLIFWGMGVSQHIHGTDNSRCLISLALMTGNVGKPGAGLHPLRGQNNVQGASDAGLIPMFLPDYQSVTDDGIRAKFTNVWNDDRDFSNEKGLTVTEIIDQAYAGNIKGMYIQGENPAMSDPDVNHARDALAKLELMIVQDIFLTETANYADIILPASALYEKNGTVSNTNRQVQRVRPAVNPPGEAREDWKITVELARRIGLNWDYSDVSQVFAEMKLTMNSLDNITWERLETETITYPSLSETDPGQAIVFGDGFPRADGRARFTPASVIPPDEAPDDEYPMIATTGRQLEHWHTGSMTRRSNVLDAVEPEANCSMNPRTLKLMGIEPGDMIRLTTRRGSIEIMVRADRAIAEDMVFIPFAYVEAAANILTNSAIDPYGKIPEFKFSAIRVEKIADAVAAE